MPNKETHPNSHGEAGYKRGGKLIDRFADKKVRQYDTHDPRLVIDLPKTGKQNRKLIVDKFSPFETNTFTNIDRVEIIKGHHKAVLLFGFGKSENFDGGLRHQVFSPDGFVGFAYGENLDYLLASLVHDDPRLKELAEKGQASFDIAVNEFLEKELGISIASK